MEYNPLIHINTSYLHQLYTASKLPQRNNQKVKGTPEKKKKKVTRNIIYIYKKAAAFHEQRIHTDQIST
jgi:hypothetical protein